MSNEFIATICMDRPNRYRVEIREDGRVLYTKYFYDTSIIGHDGLPQATSFFNRITGGNDYQDHSVSLDILAELILEIP